MKIELGTLQTLYKILDQIESGDLETGINNLKAVLNNVHESNEIEISKLWKQIAINNASNSNEPHKVANETIEMYKRVFLKEKTTN